MDEMRDLTEKFASVVWIFILILVLGIEIAFCRKLENTTQKIKDSVKETEIISADVQKLAYDDPLLVNSTYYIEGGNHHYYLLTVKIKNLKSIDSGFAYLGAKAVGAENLYLSFRPMYYYGEDIYVNPVSETIPGGTEGIVRYLLLVDKEDRPMFEEVAVYEESEKENRFLVKLPEE